MAERKAAPRLGEFLRARRALVRPDEHGLPSGARRTPGLRREEVAMLAGVSTDYYTRLEQGREAHPSPQVIAVLAAALLLEEEAAAYLRGLAGPAPARPARRPQRREYASPTLVAMMDAWPDTPALVYGRYMDLLAANPLGEALFSWLGEETNLLRGVFLNPAARAFYRDWATIGQGCIAALRAANTDPDDPRLVELVGELSLKSQDFARLWGRHEVREKTAATKHFDHPVVGALALRFENLSVNGAPGQHLVVYHAEAGSPEANALALLGSYTATPAPEPSRQE